MIDGAVPAAGSEAASTVSVKVLLSVPAEFPALTLNLKIPDSAGVPEIVPELLNVRPEGRLPLPTLQVIGVVPVASSSAV